MFLKNINIKLVLALIIINANIVFLKASHIVGGEISYKHLKDFQYEFYLKIFRDCNSCKFNGVGGGNNNQNCNELPMLKIHGALGSNYSQQFFSSISLERVKTTDITPTCYTSKSKCQNNSDVNLGVEMHEMTGVFDFSSLVSQGFCNFDVSIDVSSRNNNINTNLTEQKFFNFTQINICDNFNHSVEFENNKYNILYLNQTNRISLGVNNYDNDSLSFKLVQALTNRTQSVNYDLNRSYDKPFSIYCQGSLVNCTPNIQSNPSEGFYINEKTGDVQLTPIYNGQGGVIVIQCEEWKKDPNGNRYLAGLVRRDINFTVESINNNLPIIENIKTELSWCKGELINLPILLSDVAVSGFSSDSLELSLIDENNFFNINFNYTNQAPYRQYYLTANNDIPAGNYHFSIVVKDNNCPFNGITSKTFYVKILEKTPIKYSKEIKNCGMLIVKSLNQLNNDNTWTITNLNGEILKQSIGRNLTYQFENTGYFLLKIQTKENENYCQNILVDTIYTGNLNKPIFELPVNITVCENLEFYVNPNKLETYDNYEIWHKNQVINFPFKSTLLEDELLSFSVRQQNGCHTTSNILANVNKKIAFEALEKTYCYTENIKFNLNELLNIDLLKFNSLNFEINNPNIVVNKIDEKHSDFEIFNLSDDFETDVEIFLVDINGCQYNAKQKIKIIFPEKLIPKIPHSLCSNFGKISLPVFNNGIWINKINGETLEDNIIENSNKHLIN